jgi:hypothetical protein
VRVHDRYPAYVPWETCARMQARLHDTYAAYAHTQRRGVPRQGAARLQGIVDGGSGGPKMAGQYKGGKPYLGHYLRSQAHAPVGQRLPAEPVAQPVVAAFCDALAPAALDLYAQALAQRQQQQAELDRAQRYSVQRREAAADQARRRAEQVEPAYRLVAAALARRWAAALQA